MMMVLQLLLVMWDQGVMDLLSNTSSFHRCWPSWHILTHHLVAVLCSFNYPIEPFRLRNSKSIWLSTQSWFRVHIGMYYSFPSTVACLAVQLGRTVLQFTILPSGLNLTLQVLAKTMEPVALALYLMDIQLHQYPYDWLIQVSTHHQCMAHSALVLACSHQMGLPFIFVTSHITLTNFALGWSKVSRPPHPSVQKQSMPSMAHGAPHSLCIKHLLSQMGKPPSLVDFNHHLSPLSTPLNKRQ